MDSSGVIEDVDRAQQARIERLVLAIAQPANGLDDLVIAAASVGIPPVPVIRGPISVNRDADLDLLLGEQLTDAVVEQDAVGVDPQVKLADLLNLVAQDLADMPQPGYAREERFASMQDDANRCQCVVTSVFRYPLCSLGDCFVGDYLRAAAPALVGVLINIAVITRKVTSTAYLEHELPERPDFSRHICDMPLN